MFSGIEMTLSHCLGFSRQTMVWTTIFLIIVLAFIQFRMSVKHLLVVDKMYPGPIKLPFIGCAITVFRRRRDLRDYGAEVFWWYRRSFRVWILHQVNICLFAASDVEKVLSSSVSIEKAAHYDNLLGWIGRGLLTSYGTTWKKHRKILTPAFHFNILETFLEIFNRNGDLLCEKLNNYAGGANFDVYQLIKLYALDNICEAAMGTKINAQIYPDSDYVKAVKSICEVIFTRNVSPWLWPDFLFNLSKEGRRHREAVRVIHQFSSDVIAKRQEEIRMESENNFEEGNRRKVFLDILLRSKEEGGLTFQEIKDEVDTFMFEGHDTITSALSFLLHALATNPAIQEKAYKEQIEIFGDDERSPTLRESNAMKYLELVIKESLRHYPPVPIIGRKVTEDIVLDEMSTIPKGSQVLIFAEVLHRYPTEWEKSEEFYPEHFEPENAIRRHPFQYIPFSAGPRNCIGQRFAMLEMKSAVSKLLRRFRILPSCPTVPLKLNVDLILVSDTGINIRLEKR